MIPEYILKEERAHNYSLLIVLAFLSTVIGFVAAKMLFPSQIDVLAVIFASIPLIYPLTRFLLDDEKENAPHSPEIAVYFSIFVGQVIAFTSISLYFPDAFETQLDIIGAAGYAVEPTAAFTSILFNNMTVFAAIFLLSLIITSAGVFIVSWNASVMGAFFAHLISELPTSTALLVGTSEVPTPLAFIPHGTLEMLGFIVAGITGTLMSAAIYRKHFQKSTWKDLMVLLASGAILVILGAIIEAF